jgi:tRNA dimethylallyltransferase
MPYWDGEQLSGKSDGNRFCPLVVLVGPTAVGKTAISLQLAARFGGEIVSADSRLFYRGLDIGTAKPSNAELSQVPHHLIDICMPDETITLGEYRGLAMAAIRDIQARGRVPFLVGGTGQYIRAIVEGWGIPEVPPQKRFREILADMNDQEVVRWLRFLDPLSARRIDPRNIRRVIRALEVTITTGRPMSQLQQKHPLDDDILNIGLTCKRDILYARIDGRVDRMMAAGFLDEVKELTQKGYNRHLPAMSGLGYRQLLAYLGDELTLVQAIERIKFETHRFARQQYTWFRIEGEDIHWFDVQEPAWMDAVEDKAGDWLRDNGYLKKILARKKTV